MKNKKERYKNYGTESINHDRYMTDGDIPSYAYQNFCEMYDAYHALGGNGMITKMKHEIEELHLKKKEGNSHEKN